MAKTTFSTQTPVDQPAEVSNGVAYSEADFFAQPNVDGRGFYTQFYGAIGLAKGNRSPNSLPQRRAVQSAPFNYRK